MNVTRALASASYRFIGWGQGDGADGQCGGSKDNCGAKYDELDAPEAVTPVDVEAHAEDMKVDTAADSVTDAEHDTAENHPAVAIDNQVLPDTDLLDATLMEPANLTALLQQRSGGWARFCNDADCSYKCGEWVSMTDAGCLNENFRGFI